MQCCSTDETPSASEFLVEGMNCANCRRHVQEAIETIPGVDSAAVDLDKGRATVRWRDPGVATIDAVVSAVSAAGFKATPASQSDGAEPAATPNVTLGWKFNVFFGGALTLPLILGEWILGLGATEGFKWFGFALSTPVMAVCGRRFFRGAWQQLRRGHSNMDTLVSLGSSTAYFYSLWGLLAGWSGHLYFMEAAGIITLISVGHWLEAIAGARAGAALQALMQLAPATARRLTSDETEEEIPIAELSVDDRMVIRPGDVVPTDGEVVEGASALDESMLTGESLPIEKSPGTVVFAGTHNQNGRLLVRVTATGDTTALAQIIAVVERAQNSRANIQRLGDRVSSVFVPVVVFIALVTALAWGLNYEPMLRFAQGVTPSLWPISFPVTALSAAFIHAAAVLIVACPCAMGLATPAAIMAGTNAAARRGILIRDGQALEKSGKITALVFDKTGTLTQGSMEVVHQESLGGADATTLASVANALASPSNHPVSRAIAAWKPSTDRASGTSLNHWEELRGKGVQAEGEATAAGIYRLGALNWLREHGVSLAQTETSIARWTEEGATVLGLAHTTSLLALFVIRDTLKPGAEQVVTQLQQEGKSVFLITGDNPRTARAIAQQVGISESNVFAEVRPEEKAEIIQQLQNRNERVAFIGDGINDAPALKQADLGIAVRKASDVAREAADIILLKSDIQAIPEALGLAQATLRTIKQNLFWAFFYNAAAIPLAAIGFLSPVICALAMGMSDVVVIGNALRLQRWRK